MDPAQRQPNDTMTVGAPAPVARQVPVKWANSDVPVLFANMIWGIVDDLGDIVLTVARVDPAPIASKDPEERRREIEAVTHVEGNVLFRFSASPERLKLMMDAINQSIETREKWRREVLGKEGAQP